MTCHQLKLDITSSAYNAMATDFVALCFQTLACLHIRICNLPQLPCIPSMRKTSRYSTLDSANEFAIVQN